MFLVACVTVFAFMMCCLVLQFSADLKEVTTVSFVGVLLCVGGELLRKLAMFTAKTNFNHIVQSVHEEGHRLVTHGVYNYCRHPSYVGWFYWSIGTQVCT
jgi:protein-S-isoprenylcysteine O-methyltransferase